MDPKCSKQYEIANVFGVTPRAVSLWSAEGCPRNRDGTYTLAEVVAWRTAKLIEKARTEGFEEGQAAAGSGESNERWQAARAALKEIELAERRREFLRRDEIQPPLLRWLNAHAQRLHALPALVAGKLAGAGNQAAIQQAVEEALSHEVRRTRQEFQEVESLMAPPVSNSATPSSSSAKSSTKGSGGRTKSASASGLKANSASRKKSHRRSTGR